MAIFVNIAKCTIINASQRLRAGVFAEWEFTVQDQRGNLYEWVYDAETLDYVGTPTDGQVAAHIAAWMTGVGGYVGIEEITSSKNALKDTRATIESIIGIEPGGTPTVIDEDESAFDAQQGGSMQADVRFRFSGAATLNSEIELISGDGAQRTYQAKDSVTNGQADGTDGDGQPRILFDRGSSATESATNLVAAIYHSNGHTGSRLTASANGLSGLVSLTQTVHGTDGNKPITLDQTSGVDFTAATSINPPAAFTGGE